MIQLIIVLVVLGFLMYLLNTYVPMASPFKEIINFIIVLCVILWILSTVGMLGPMLPPRLR